MSVLGYKEIFEYKHISLNTYLQNGGLGDVIANYDDLEKVQLTLNEIFNDIVWKDIIERNKIKNKEEFKKIVNYIFKTFGKKINSTNIINFLKSNKEKIIPKSTLMRYFSFICDSMIINKVKYFNTKSKSELSNKCKYYCGDLGLFNVINGFDINDSTRNIRIENLMYLYFLEKGYEIFTYENESGYEIDFVLRKNNTIKYIQICEKLNDENFERETRSLLSIKDGFEKIIICAENNTIVKSVINNGVKVLDLKQVLLENILI
ncbi:MAG: DUF4143 domain-containing protein [Mycoplasmataceae bacterium]|nr:DUF4143 domain-containing protein [Mycoplasmataceae bacterium]